jgi:hypothetical protein
VLVVLVALAGLEAPVTVLRVLVEEHLGLGFCILLEVGLELLGQTLEVVQVLLDTQVMLADGTPMLRCFLVVGASGRPLVLVVLAQKVFVVVLVVVAVLVVQALTTSVERVEVMKPIHKCQRLLLQHGEHRPAVVLVVVRLVVVMELLVAHRMAVAVADQTTVRLVEMVVTVVLEAAVVAAVVVRTVTATVAQAAQVGTHKSRFGCLDEMA